MRIATRPVARPCPSVCASHAPGSRRTKLNEYDAAATDSIYATSASANIGPINATITGRNVSRPSVLCCGLMAGRAAAAAGEDMILLPASFIAFVNCRFNKQFCLACLKNTYDVTNFYASVQFAATSLSGVGVISGHHAAYHFIYFVSEAKVHRKRNEQTDRQTDRQTNRQIEKLNKKHKLTQPAHQQNEEQHQLVRWSSHATAKAYFSVMHKSIKARLIAKLLWPLLLLYVVYFVTGLMDGGIVGPSDRLVAVSRLYLITLDKL